MAKMTKCLTALLVIGALSVASPASAQQCQQQESPGRTFFSTLVGAFLPPTWAAIAQGGLNLLVGRNRGTTNSACAGQTTVAVAPTPVATTPAVLPSTTTQPPTVTPTPTTGATVTPALAYTLYKIERTHSFAPATATDRYAPGEGVVIVVSNNVPGILQVTNIDGNGVRTQLDALRSDSPLSTYVPSRASGVDFFEVQADSTTDEIIELRFTPCNATAAASGRESMLGARAPDVRTSIEAALRPEVIASMPSCEAATGDRESMLGRSDPALRAAIESARSNNINIEPIIVTIAVRRA